MAIYDILVLNTEMGILRLNDQSAIFIDEQTIYKEF
jgi:hypothetical protein